MALPFDLPGSDPDSVSLWHRRGSARFAGLGFVVLTLASVATDSLTLDTAVALAATMAVTGLLFGVLVATGWVSHRWSLLLWPVSICSGIFVLDQVAHQAAGLATGFITLSFLFIGLCQPPRTGLWFVVPAAVVLLQVMDLEPREAFVRLPVSALVWIVCSEMPAKLIQQLREKQAALELLATTDSLTGLLNRTRLDVHLEHVGAGGAVVLIDLDHFKQFNDRHGHVAGDVALMDFATALRANVRAHDAVFRFGGEEFLVVMAGTTPADAARVMHGVKEAWSGHGSGLTFSAGVTSGGISAVRAADKLLYAAKAAGRDRVVVDTGTSDAARV